MNKNDYILIAEDNEDLRIMIKVILEADGYEVILAVDGQEAMEYIQDRLPALLLTDYDMPVMAGPVLIAILRERFTIEELPIVLMSAFGLRGDEIPDGINEFLPKPFQVEGLKKVVAQFLPVPGLTAQE